MPEKDGKTGSSYRIGELSRITGVKAGTIRFYEKCGYVGPVGRSANNYRIYEERHIFQVRVCSLVFGGFVNRRLRRESLKVLDAAARWDMAAYAKETANYRRAVEEDIVRTEKAIAICMEQMGQDTEKDVRYTKKQAAAILGTTPEAIRNWERNGLLGLFEPYQKRFYGQELINRMYVIRLLLDTGYSMMAIRSFMQEYTSGRAGKAEMLLLNPRENEELLYRSDRYLEALQQLREKTLQLCGMTSDKSYFR